MNEANKKEPNLITLRRSIAVFRIFEIISIVVFLLILSFAEINEVMNYSSLYGLRKFVFDIVSYSFGMLILLIALVLSIIGFVKDDMFYSKWGMLLLHITITIIQIIQVGLSIYHHEAIGVLDIISAIVGIVTIVLIAKEMASLYAITVVKFLTIISIVLVFVSGTIVGLSIAGMIVAYVESMAKGADALTSMLIIIAGTLLPSISFLFYPGAIRADYIIQDNIVRKEAISNQE